MKAAVLVESMTGHTWKAGERIANDLTQEGWEIVGFDRLRQPDHSALQAADIVIVGTWVDGLFVVGQKPFGAAAIGALPAIAGKQAAVFCTFALNPRHTLDKMTSIVSGRGANVIGGLALHRSKIDEHAETFASRLVGAVVPTA
jgi:nucleoside-diphosphate-sugar epimerase